jgi:eukaryotic-like serine/threonine-protein kinase
LIGATLGQDGKYEIVRLLGQGGMGCVYEAEHRDTRERFAVKVLHSHLIEPSGEGTRRFLREAQAARSIRGDHVVRVIEAGTDEATGQLYLVTEHLDGEDLQRLLDRVGPLQPEGALRVASLALLGIAEAHEARVIHRDIKPANIFLARGAGGAITVKLLDFGIAKIKADPLSAPYAAGLTTTGGFLGSPLYMSPEQVQNSRDVDHRTDLWSLGSVLYAALAGRAPHQHLASIGQLLVSICTTPPPALLEVAPWVPAEIAAIVHAALAIRPEDRYPSAAAMLAAIRRLVASTALDDELLAPSGQRPRDVVVSTIPPSPAFPTPRVVVAPIRGDEPTEREADREIAAARERASRPTGSETWPSTAAGAPTVARSEVPAVGARAGARAVTVDPRRFLGEKSEIWSFSLDVHRHVSSLVARIWKALRRSGADVPPMTYGTKWVLVEARTGQPIIELGAGGTAPLSLEAAGIRPGIVLWVVPSPWTR